MPQFCNTQRPIRCRNHARARDPFGLDPIEPRALDRQGTHRHPAAVSLRDRPVVRLKPPPHGLADVPRGLGPDQPQDGFAFGGHPGRQPRENLRRPPSLAARPHNGGACPGCPRVTAHNTRWLGAPGHGGPAPFASRGVAWHRSRHGGWAGPSGSPPHPESPRPSPEALTPALAGDRAPFFRA